jgi:HK97 family phage portal protein
MITTLREPASWFLNFFGLGDAGSVTNRSMAGMPAVWYAMQKIGGDIGKMPLEPRITKSDGRGSDPHRVHPAFWLLRDEPNNFQTPDVFKELVTVHALGWGNGRAAIIRDGIRPAELIPMMPDRSDTVMVQGEKYHVTMPCEDDPLRFSDARTEMLESGKIPQNMIVLHDRDVLHIIGLGFDGVKGLSIAQVFQDALGIGLNGQRLMRNQMKKGFTAKVMLKDEGGAFQGKDAEKQAKDFIEDFRDRFSNSGAGEVAGMLRRGMTHEVLSMSNADAQLLEQMRYGRQDVMLIFGLQHLPGDSSATSYNSLEQKKLDQLESTNDRWMTRWELQCDAKLRTESEKKAGRVYFKFNAGSRLRTDIVSTANTLSTLMRATIITRNEAREKLEMNPVDGGDEFENPAITVRETEKDESRADRARNKWQELVAVESKRVMGIVSKKSLKDCESALQKFYLGWAATVSEAMGCGEDDAVLLGHVKQLETAMVESKSIEEFRNKVSGIVAEWKDEDVF